MVKRLFRAMEVAILACFLFSVFCITANALDLAPSCYDEPNSADILLEENASLLYVIKDGSPYYECSWGFGSGRYGIVETENAYTDIPCIVGLNGYAFLDESGNVISSDYIEDETDIIIPEIPEDAVKLFMHFQGPIYRNGWTDVVNISLRNGNEPKIPERLWPFYYPDGLPFEPIAVEDADDFIIEDVQNAEITVPNELDISSKFEKIISQKTEEEASKSADAVAEDIQTITSNSKSVVLVDVSGSMNAHYLSVLSYLQETEFPEDTVFIAFNTDFKVVSFDNLVMLVSDPYGETDIHGALNYITSNYSDFDSVILLSDMMQSVSVLFFFPVNVPIAENLTVDNLIIYTPINASNYTKNSEIAKIKQHWYANIVEYAIEDDDK